MFRPSSPGLTGRSSTPRPTAQSLTSLDYWLPRLKGGMTIECAAAVETYCSIPAARIASELCVKHRPRSEEGAGKAGCRPHPWPASNKKSWRQSPQDWPNIRPSLRGGFNGVLRALPGEPGFLAPIASRIVTARLSAGVGAPGPHDFAVRSSAVRPHENVRVAACVHRIPPHVR